MSDESAHLSTFGAETETEAEIRSTSNIYHLKFGDVPLGLGAAEGEDRSLTVYV